MLEGLNGLAQIDGNMLAGVWSTAKNWVLIFAGFSLVIFVHELGHFLAAKLCRVRVDKFAVGFGRAIFAYRRGVGLTWGPTEAKMRRRIEAHVDQKRSHELQLREKIDVTEAESAAAARELGIAETEYAFNLLPLGGYVKMLGQEDFTIDKSGEWKVKEDPRAFTHKPIGQRMFIVSAGVFMNLVFAAAVFALVFMAGLPAIPAQVGQVLPGSPADQAGLRVGDRITRVNGQRIMDQSDLQMAVVLSDPDERLEVTFDRTDAIAGQTKRETVAIASEMSRADNIQRIGVAPPLTNVVRIAIDLTQDPDDQLKSYDRIVSVDGQPVSSFYQIQDLLANKQGDWCTLEVDRPIGELEQGTLPNQDRRETHRIERRRRALLMMLPAGPIEEGAGHLLGFMPRQRIGQVLDGQRADLAGFEPGDVIVRFGDQATPRYDEIMQVIEAHPERDIRVVVFRPGEGEKHLVVRPRVTGWLTKSRPAIGVSLGLQEIDRLVVADILTEINDSIPTPAAVLKGLMPRGALITKLNDEPVHTWTELVQRFTALAGTDVKVSWTFEGCPEQAGSIHVPQTIGTTFDLPGSHQILSINGVSRKEVEVKSKRITVSADHWLGAQAILRDHIGQPATVVFKNSLQSAPQTVVIDKVTPEMLDTWVLRIKYLADDISTWPETVVVRETNPLKASLIGLRKTYNFIEQAYVTMQRMIITRSMGVEQISGPVGILQLGSQTAALGLPSLFFFLALISANLAVINFLPLPIVDGGIFVFLLIEKIKGSPLSMKVQVATQLIGLALIIGIFLFVTIQDLQKWVG